jgi:serine/threonine-protein kinase/endoribonuclease IRE1
MPAQGLAGKRSAADKEKQLLQRLAAVAGTGSDNVIKYRCVEDNPDRVFMGMELCLCSLFDVIGRPASALAGAESSGGLPRIGSEQERMRVMQQLLSGTAFLHSHGVVHSDIRPKNVLFVRCPSGSCQLGTLKLADFGLSNEGVNAPDQSFTMTTTPTGLGGWYAPEVQRRGKKTQKVDVFMLGCCLCYILTGGRHPFDAHDCPEARAGNPIQYVRIANVQGGKHDLGPLLGGAESAHARDPAALDLLQAMVDIEASERPTVAQAQAHPFFWPAGRRHDFLCACGNLGEVKSGSGNAHSLLPPSLLPDGREWSEAVDPALWKQAKAHARYNTRSVPDLLRFLRNTQQHGADRDMQAGMAAAAAEMGGPAAYFERLFPWLLVPVWRAAPSLESGQQLSSFLSGSVPGCTRTAIGV